MSDKRPLSLVVCFLAPLAILILGGVGIAAVVFSTIPELAKENGRAKPLWACV